jgi:hypothetical protein
MINIHQLKKTLTLKRKDHLEMGMPIKTEEEWLHGMGES